MMGKDHTIFAVTDGMVKFDRSATRARICIVPVVEEAEPAAKADTRKTRKYAKCVPWQPLAGRAGATACAHGLILRPAACRRFPPRATLAAAGAEAR